MKALKKISGFDLGMIIAFVVVALLGGGAWWYLSGQLQAAQDDVRDAEEAFNQYSVAKGGSEDIVVSPSNEKTLQDNIDLLMQQLNPLIDTKLALKNNKLASITTEDPVAWKHDLDDDVHQLTDAAKVHGVALPANFYFGFSRYLSQSPNDEQTAVLSKQLLGIDAIASLLIKSPVKGIQVIRRSYEEDPRPVNGQGNNSSSGEPDHLSAYSVTAPGDAYIAYPFEVEFDTTAENLRGIIDSLVQSPTIFVIRTMTIQNSNLTSPALNDLDKIAGTPDASVTSSSPGEVAATTSTKGPQFLFGNSIIRVLARIDMIEWTAPPLGAAPPAAPAPNGSHHAPPATGVAP